MTATTFGTNRKTVLFDDARQLKRAMQAVRTIITNVNPRYSPKRGLLTVQPPTAENADVEAHVQVIDGHRALDMIVAARAPRLQETLKVELPKRIVQGLANWTETSVSISLEGQILEIESEGTEQDTATVYKPEFPETEFRRVLTNGAAGGTSAAIQRLKALATARRIPKTANDVVRLCLTEDGLHVWGTNTLKIKGSQEPVGALGPRRDGKAPIVFGMTRQYLVDALRTLTAKAVTIKVSTPFAPIYIVSDDGREQLAIAAASLE